MERRKGKLANPSPVSQATTRGARRSAPDLTNLLTSADIPIVLLSNDLRLRYFTPAAKRALDLTRSDVGRPVAAIQSHLQIPNLKKLLSDVIRESTPKQMDVRDRGGFWFSERIVPYRTQADRV